MNIHNIATGDETRTWEETYSMVNPIRRLQQAKIEQARITRIVNRLKIESDMQRMTDLLNEVERQAHKKSKYLEAEQI